MNVIKHTLPDYDRIEILPLADLHIGDIHSDGKKIMEWLKYIEEHENCYCILNGDLCNVAIRNSLSDIYGENPMPMQQLEQCVKIFGPIKDKILAVTSGNHEARIYKTDGLDMTQIMCNQLGIGDRYAPATALLFVTFGMQNGHKNHYPVTYSIMVSHGNGGGRLESSKINRLLQLASICDADIYIHSHTHVPAIVRNSYYRTFAPRKSIEKVDRLFVNTSSSLEYGGYGEFQNYKPNSIETPIITLSGRERKMWATL